jgi:ribosomal protein S18 acetylase RimI-like enzyme
MATIALAGPDRIDELRPLWLELHHHHASVSRVQPFVDDETSWTVRRRTYAETFEHGGFALVAEEDGLVGYAMVRIHQGPDDSWALADRYGEVWTVLVAERVRGRGIGSALLDAVDAELARRGIHDLVIGVMEGNDGARRLYERRGLVPGWVQLYRVGASRAQAASSAATTATPASAADSEDAPAARPTAAGPTRKPA